MVFCHWDFSKRLKMVEISAVFAPETFQGWRKVFPSPLERFWSKNRRDLYHFQPFRKIPMTKDHGGGRTPILSQTTVFEIENDTKLDLNFGKLIDTLRRTRAASMIHKCFLNNNCWQLFSEWINNYHSAIVSSWNSESLFQSSSSSLVITTRFSQAL